MTSPLTDVEFLPDSGATSDMRKDRSVFEDDYVACNDVFVLMGDGHEIPVLGYGTFRMKIDGYVTRLINSLYVPGLDCDFFLVHDMALKERLFICVRRRRNALNIPKIYHY